MARHAARFTFRPQPRRSSLARCSSSLRRSGSSSPTGSSHQDCRCYSPFTRSEAAEKSARGSGSALARDSAKANRPLSADTVEKLSRSLLREGRPTTDSVVLTERPQSIDGLSASAEFFNSIGRLLPLWSARRKVGIRGRSRRRRDRPMSVRFRGRTWCLSWRKTADRKAWRRPTGRARVRRTLECA